MFEFWILSAIAAAVVGNSKGSAGMGFLLGVLFGPFGVLFAFFLNGNRKECPACKSKIHKDASICPQCRTPLNTPEAPTEPRGRLWGDTPPK